MASIPSPAAAGRVKRAGSGTFLSQLCHCTEELGSESISNAGATTSASVVDETQPAPPAHWPQYARPENVQDADDSIERYNVFPIGYSSMSAITVGEAALPMPPSPLPVLLQWHEGAHHESLQENSMCTWQGGGLIKGEYMGNTILSASICRGLSTHVRTFPPPISSLLSVRPIMRSFKSNGRFILKRLETTFTSPFCALRRNGRLRLILSSSSTSSTLDDSTRDLQLPLEGSSHKEGQVEVTIKADDLQIDKEIAADQQGGEVTMKAKNASYELGAVLYPQEKGRSAELSSSSFDDHPPLLCVAKSMKLWDSTALSHECLPTLKLLLVLAQRLSKVASDAASNGERWKRKSNCNNVGQYGTKLQETLVVDTAQSSNSSLIFDSSAQQLSSCTLLMQQCPYNIASSSSSSKGVLHHYKSRASSSQGVLQHYIKRRPSFDEYESKGIIYNQGYAIVSLNCGLIFILLESTRVGIRVKGTYFYNYISAKAKGEINEHSSCISGKFSMQRISNHLHSSSLPSSACVKEDNLLKPFYSVNTLEPMDLRIAA